MGWEKMPRKEKVFEVRGDKRGGNRELATIKKKARERLRDCGGITT